MNEVVKMWCDGFDWKKLQKQFSDSRSDTVKTIRLMLAAASSAIRPARSPCSKNLFKSYCTEFLIFKCSIIIDRITILRIWYWLKKFDEFWLNLINWVNYYLNSVNSDYFIEFGRSFFIEDQFLSGDEPKHSNSNLT